MVDDLRIEIPKVKIDASKTIDAMEKLKIALQNGQTQCEISVEKIVKDIQDRKDNAMAMEFTKCIGELLKNNGVVPKITEYIRKDMKENSIEELYGVSIDELDFTKHDKVFKDKIAELENRIRELDIIDSVRIDEKRELKQHIEELKNKNMQLIENILQKETKIHELENKENDIPTNINLNDQIKVKLTPLGAEIYYHQYDELNKNIKANGGTPLEPTMPQIDKDGYTKFTLWHFMELYGQHFGICKPNVIEPLNIYFVED